MSLFANSARGLALLGTECEKEHPRLRICSVRFTCCLSVTTDLQNVIVCCDNFNVSQHLHIVYEKCQNNSKHLNTCTLDLFVQSIKKILRQSTIDIVSVVKLHTTLILPT